MDLPVRFSYRSNVPSPGRRLMALEMHLIQHREANNRLPTVARTMSLVLI